MARSEWNETPTQPRVRKSSRRHGLRMSAGMASATTTMNGLRMEGLNGRVHLDISGDSAQHLGGGTQSEREEQEDGRPTTRAAVKTREIEGRRGQGQTNGRGKVVGEKGTMRRPTGPRQPQGAASAPPHPPSFFDVCFFGFEIRFLVGKLSRFTNRRGEVAGYPLHD